jgi:hypothetical protein
VSVALLGFAVFLELTVYRGRDGLNSVWLNIPVLQNPSNGNYPLSPTTSK